MPFPAVPSADAGVTPGPEPRGWEGKQLLAEALTLGVTQPRRNQHPPTCRQMQL